MTVTSCWVICKTVQVSRGEDHVPATQYWSGMHGWQFNPYLAIRFSRRLDCEMVGEMYLRNPVAGNWMATQYQFEE
jgi:hypothetical protein